MLTDPSQSLKRATAWGTSVVHADAGGDGARAERPLRPKGEADGAFSTNVSTDCGAELTSQSVRNAMSNPAGDQRTRTELRIGSSADRREPLCPEPCTARNHILIE